MALELLYGPSDVTVDGIAVASIGGFMWLQGIGLLAVLHPTGGSFGFYAVQMDGVAEGPRSGYNGIGFNPVLDLRSTRGLAVKTASDLYNFNWLVGQPDPTSFLHSFPGVLSIAVITADRYVGFFDSGSGVQAQSTHDGTTYTAEYTFSAPFTGGTLVNVSRGRSTTEVCLVFNSGQIRFYDTIGKTQSGPTLFIGEDPDGCWYVPKHDVFVELKNKQLKILANAIQPATLSDPAATPAVGAGLVSQLQVQLLGAQGEPCVGELIDWSVSAGVGSLTVPQSATDSSGHATSALVVPVGSTGSVTVNAQLNY
jgi:hypothetical protein